MYFIFSPINILDGVLEGFLFVTLIPLLLIPLFVLAMFIRPLLRVSL